MNDKLREETTHMELMDYIWRLLFNINHSNEVTPLIQEQRNKLAAYYDARKSPSSLFRYRPLELGEVIDRELETLKDRKMWFSTKTALNDVFEIHVKEPSFNDFEHLCNLIKPLSGFIENSNDMLERLNDIQKQRLPLEEVKKEELLRKHFPDLHEC